jgi:PAS domain S-box-containing protein
MITPNTSQSEESSGVQRQLLDVHWLSGLLTICQSRPQNTGHLLQMILEQVLALSHSQAGFIAFFDQANQVLPLCAWKLLPQNNYILLKNLPVEKAGEWAVALRQGKKVIIHDLSRKALSVSEGPELLDLNFQFCGLPVICHEKMVGVLSLVRSERIFIDHDLQILEAWLNEAWQIIVRFREEETYRQTKQTYRLAVEAASDGLWTWNIAENSFVFSPNCEKIIDLAKLPANYEEWKAILHPEDSEHVVQSVKAHLRGESEIWNAEFRFKTSQGSWKYLSCRGRVVERNAAGLPIKIAGAIRDITENRIAEIEKIQSEERFRQLAENISEVFWLRDIRTGKILYISPKYEEVYGVSCQDLYNDPSNFLKSLHPDDKDRIVQAVREMSVNQQTYDLEYRIIRPNGEQRWLWARTYPVFDEDGQFVRVAGLTEDITQRKVTEETLRLSEEKFRRVYDLSPISKVMVSLDFRFLDCNDAFCKFLGYAKQELLGKTFLEFTHSEDQSIGQTELKAIKTGTMEEAHFSKRYVRKDGNFVWGELSIRLIQQFQNNPAYYLAVIVDITERKLTEQALSDSEKRFRDLFNASPQAILVMQQGKYIFFNPASLKLLGYQPEELNGMDVMKIIAPEDQPKLIERAKRIQDQKDNPPLEITVLCKNGQTKFCETTSVPILFNNQPAALILSLDITERKAAQAALAEERNLLARRVEERTLDLSRANAELARSARMKDEFLSNMSHELRTPLTGILGLTEALTEGVYGALDPIQIKTLKTVHESGQHLLSMINDILDLSKIEAGKLELQLGPTLLENVCSSAMRMIKQQAARKQLLVFQSTAPKLSYFQADERRIKQILVNLLGNAVKFTPAGGKVGLEVALDIEQSAIRFCVWDTGIGIPEERMNTLFRPFVQLDSTLARKYEGSGLGLSLVHRLVEMHGGSISVESKVGEGSRFTFLIPYIEVTEPVSFQSMNEVIKTIQNELTPNQAGPLILLAEDNPISQKMTSDFLIAKGFKVIFSNNGQETLEQSLQHHPDLILMDIQMPGMDGLEATRQLRSLAEFAQTPIIALTALAMPGDRERCLEAGANEYYTKPVSLKSLVVLINQLILPDSLPPKEIL